jgi:hypothetical protein
VLFGINYLHRLRWGQTAPVRQGVVTVSDLLDVNLNWSILVLNQFEFNNATINMPSGARN